MKCICSDQEGAVISDFVGLLTEKFTMERDLAGSEGHTGASLAERHIQLTQISALKLWHDAKRLRLHPTKRQVVQEAAMCQNLLLNYGGATPAQGPLGYAPTDPYEWNVSGRAAYEGAVHSPEDAGEFAMRMRMAGKDAILKSIGED